jgi:hypothetical protein
MTLAKTIPVHFEEEIDLYKFKVEAENLIKKKFSERNVTGLGLFENVTHAVYFNGFTDSDCNERQIWCLQYFVKVITLIEDCKPQIINDGRTIWSVAEPCINKSLSDEEAKQQPKQQPVGRYTKLLKRIILDNERLYPGRPVLFHLIYRICLKEIYSLMDTVVTYNAKGPPTKLCEKGGRTTKFFNSFCEGTKEIDRRLNRPKVQDDERRAGAITNLNL